MNLNEPLVSIIIPTFNRGHLIGETLDSILCQTYSNWECLIVDDRSKDYTEELVEFYSELDSRIKYYKRPISLPNEANSCRNYGFELSKGEYVQWFDSDDIMLRDFLRIKVQMMKKKFKFIICSGYYTNSQLKAKKIISINKDLDLFKSYVLQQNKVYIPSILFRRDFLINTELFNAKLTRGQETDFFSRLFYRIRKKDFIIIEDLLYYYRQHNTTKTYNNLNYHSNYKSSQIYNSIENLKRSVRLKDKHLLNYIYNDLLQFFFQSIENNDYLNSIKIFRHLFPFILRFNIKLGLEFLFFGFKMILHKKTNPTYLKRLNRNVIK